MRILCFLFLLLFSAAVGAFAYFNQEPTTIRFAEWSVTSSLAMIAGTTYILGMLSGWTLIRMVRQSANRAMEVVEQRYAQNRV